MKTILAKIVSTYISSGEGNRDVNKYLDLKRLPGWAVYQGFLLHMGNMLANEVLTAKFRKLPDHEKLVKLEAYSMVSEVVRFLINPFPQFKQATDIKKHNIKMQEATAGKRPGEERDNARKTDH